jgi:hypothetical protein
MRLYEWILGLGMFPSESKQTERTIPRNLVFGRLTQRTSNIACPSRGWRNVEFTYTVAKKIKAEVLNPPPPPYPQIRYVPPTLPCFSWKESLGYHQPSAHSCEHDESTYLTFHKNLLMTVTIATNSETTTVWGRNE